VKVTCTGPKGEKFEGQTSEWRANLPGWEETASDHNYAERASLQQALETWCNSLGVDPKTAKKGK
jgi:hypothetical protein